MMKGHRCKIVIFKPCSAQEAPAVLQRGQLDDTPLLFGQGEFCLHIKSLQREQNIAKGALASVADTSFRQREGDGMPPPSLLQS